MRISRKGLFLLILAVLAGGGLYLAYDHFRSRIIFGIRDEFSRAVAYDTPVAGIPGIRAEQCGVCHTDIFEEWKTSYHAKAYVDPFFQAYWRKDKHIWICLNCHAPMQPQQPRLILGLEGGKVHRPLTAENPDFDPEFQLEGITCGSCHIRDGVIEGPYGNLAAPHPTRYSPRFRTTDICFTCHQVPSGPFQFYNGGPCSTFPEFEAGPYAKQGMICQDCHMPEVRRPLVPGGPPRDGRRHLWRGGHSPEMVRRAIGVEIETPPEALRPGEEARFTLRLTNRGAGHKIPTGDPDRFFTVSFELADGGGRTLKREQHSMGRWILWWPMIVEVYENRLSPLQHRDYQFRYRLPGKLDGLTLTARVRYHIMTEKQYQRLQTRYGLKEEVPYEFTVWEETIRLDEPLSDSRTAQAGSRSLCGTRDG